MIIDVVLPDLGEDSTAEATISEWLAKVGSSLKEGDDLLELTTDKAAFCLPCPQAGILHETLAKEGDTIAVGDAVCRLKT